MNVRETALRTLCEICADGKYSNIAVKEALADGRMSAAEKSFFTRLVYGTLDKEITLDYMIKSFSKVKMKKIALPILIILRMGAYQLKFMDSVPASAAVNESVKLARRYGHSASAGFVNGMLRSISRNEIKYPSDRIEYLSVKYSFPEKMCEKWIGDFGFEFTEELMRAFELPPELVLRPNTLKITAEELAERLISEGTDARVENGAVKADGFDIAGNHLYLDGFCTVQDTAAMQPAIVLKPAAGETIIDMCAAPGGKTAQMAEMMHNSGKILAFDIYEHKTELIRKNARRLGITIIDAQVRDSSVYDASLEESADKVLCDVPCTGTGIIGRKPDIKRNYHNDGTITVIQKAVLENGARYLKRGGVLVYSTCSIEKEENEAVTGAFLAADNGFEKIYERTYYPHTDSCDGFYVCALKKKL